MGKTKGPYNEEYQVGSLVSIRSRPFLEQFIADWKWHHPLSPEQLPFAGRAGRVKEVSFYHGGDELYELEGIPGIWHEQCLQPDAE